LSRKPDAPAAKTLADLGVQVVRGDMADQASLSEAMRGTHGVYSVQANVTAGVEGEILQGKMVADVAAESGVKHLVYSSVGGAERNSGVPHFESKWQIEEYIRKIGLPATILRPATFMDNFGHVVMRTIVLSMLKTFVADTTPLQLVAVRDIGVFAALAFHRPEEFIGQSIELAGDELARPQIIKTLQGAGIVPIASLRLPRLITRRLPADFPLMFRWFSDHGFKADITKLREKHHDLSTFSIWAKTQSRANCCRFEHRPSVSQ
jgi:uncharacterized protein YbjT (DUF2867 family)